MQLHLHQACKFRGGLYYSIVDRSTSGAEVRVEKKIKKDLTSRIEWDIKGLLTRKTKGK